MRTESRITDADRAAYLERGLQSFLTVPLIRVGRLAATLSVTVDAPRPWTPDVVTMLQDVAERTWEVAERARAEAARGASDERYRTLFDAMDQGFCTIEILFDAAD